MQQASRSINFELPSGAVPDWVQLLPSGPDIVGIDGRSWILDDQSTTLILSDFERRARPLPVDWEHATEVRAPEGLPAPAAGWIDSIERRDDGSWWGRVGWTETAIQQIAAREYRFLSPVFVYDQATGRIVSILSAGLTNTPNLPLASLNRETSSEMAINAIILTALDLATTADEQAVVAAINALKLDREKALNRAESPDLTKFVPKAEYDAALMRTANAEQSLRQQQQQEQAKLIDQVIRQALADGKITPATESYYRSACNRDGGLDEFRKFLESATPIVTAATGDTGKQIATSTDPSDVEGFKAACKSEWDSSPEVRREFGNAFNAYHSFRRAESQGRVRLISKRA